MKAEQVGSETLLVQIVRIVGEAQRSTVYLQYHQSTDRRGNSLFVFRAFTESHAGGGSYGFKLSLRYRQCTRASKWGCEWIN